MNTVVISLIGNTITTLKTFAFLVAFPLCTMPASAEEPPQFSFSHLPVGTVFTWETDRGPETRVYLGPDDDLFRFHEVFPYETGKTVEFDVWLNAENQIERALSSQIYVTTSPNDCSFTIGECSYFYLRSNGTNATILYSGHYSPEGIWFGSRWTDSDGFDSLSRISCSIVDEYGIEIANYREDYSGNTSWSRRSNGPYAKHSAELLNQVTAACLNDRLVS